MLNIKIQIEFCRFACLCVYNLSTYTRKLFFLTKHIYYETAKQQNSKTAKQQGKLTLSLLVMLPLLLLACNKDYAPTLEGNLEPATFRSSFTLTDTWINDFYDYLSDLKDNNITLASYSTDDIVDGIEVLMNIYYSEAYADENTSFYTDTIAFNSAQENAYDLFAKANTSLKNALATNDEVVVFNFKPLKETEGVKYFEATTILSGGNHQAGNGFDPCGGVENGVMTTTAITEIEKVLNREMPRDYCSERKFKYLKSEKIVISPSWSELISYEDAYCESENVLPSLGYRSCDCLDNTDLKSLTSALRAYIHDEVDNYPTWDESRFVGINLATYINPNLGDASPQVNRYSFESLLVVGKSYCNTVLDLPWTANPDLFD